MGRQNDVFENQLLVHVKQRATSLIHGSTFTDTCLYQFSRRISTDIVCDGRHVAKLLVAMSKYL